MRNSNKAIDIAKKVFSSLHRIKIAWKKWAILAAGLLVLSLVSWFLLRNSILKWALADIQEKFKARDIEFAYSSVAFSEWQTITLRKAQIRAIDHQDSMPAIEVAAIETGIRWWTFWDIGVHSLKTEGLKINYWKDSTGNSNFPLWDKQIDENSDTTRPSNLALKLFSKLDFYLDKLPKSLSMSETEVHLKINSKSWDIVLPEFDLMGKKYKGKIQGKFNNQEEAQFQLYGALNNRQLDGSSMTIEPYDEESNLVKIPLFFDSLGFSKGSFSIESIEKNDQQLSFEIISKIQRPFIQDDRLSDSLIYLNELESNLHIELGCNELKLDSQSWVMMDNIKLQPFAYIHQKDKKYALGLHIFRTSAQNFFNSLPHGLFNETRKITAQGQLEYDFSIELDGNHPDNCQLRSRMYPSSDFAINHWGKLNPRKYNSPFEYRFMEKGDLVKKFTVGPEWNGFSRLSEVSPKLIHSILQSEDPSFFKHDGFIMSAFRSSIATNYKEKKFKRGASTISMQFVKNIFLNRKKTISRKIEEILITWLIEREKIIEKNRMMEIYLNIIEWGPEVFGAKEACQYYFGKAPKDLNWRESAYLACLIPRPKSVYKTLQEDGCVNARFSHVQYLLKHMYQKDTSLGIDTSFSPLCILPESYNHLRKLNGHKPIEFVPDDFNDTMHLMSEILSE